MNDFARMYAQMMQQGPAMVRAFNPALEDYVPEGFEKLMPTMPKDWMEAMFGNAFNKDGLDAKTRLMLTLGRRAADQIHRSPSARNGRHAKGNRRSHLPDVDAGWHSGHEQGNGARAERLCRKDQ